MPQFDQIGEIYASQLFWLAIFFGAIFVVIGLGMLPKIQSTVDARDAKIAADLEAARGARQARNFAADGTSRNALFDQSRDRGDEPADAPDAPRRSHPRRLNHGQR